MRTWAVVLLVLAICGALVYLGSLNSLSIAAIDLYVARFEDVPVWAALSIAVLLGAALASLLFSLPLMRLKLRLRRSGKRVTQLEQEVHALRMVPLDETPRARARPGA